MQLRRSCEVLMSVIGLTFGSGSISGQENRETGIVIDAYSLGSARKVVVEFFDPSLSIEMNHPGFFGGGSMSERNEEKLEVWLRHLHSSAVYLFKVMTLRDRVLNYYCLRGDPSITNSSKYYQVEVIKADGASMVNPNHEDYADKIIRSVRLTTLGGSLFENMSLFAAESKPKQVGKGILFFGKFFRIIPYAEVRRSVNDVILEDLEVDG